MTPEQNQMVDAVLEKYCEWLNQWMIAEGVEHRYTVQQFRTHDPTNGLYGSVSNLVVIDQYYTFLTFYVSDGDEGGPATLSAWVYWDDMEVVINHMVQEFDTMIHSIYDSEHGFLSKP